MNTCAEPGCERVPHRDGDRCYYHAKLRAGLLGAGPAL